MAKKILLTQSWEVILPDGCDNLSDEQLVSDINGLYDNKGSSIIQEMGTSTEYINTTIEAINGIEVSKDYDDSKGGDCISTTGGNSIILDGNELDNENIIKR